MTDWIDIQKLPPEKIKKEKEKARQLKKTNWWQAELAKGVCYYCKKKFTPEELTMDHVVPISRGGKSVKGNIVPCCKECNNKKKYLTPVEMILREIENGDN